MPVITVWVDDAASETALRELAAFGEQEFGQPARRAPTAAVDRKDERGISLALIALLLSIPGAAVNAMTLAERLGLRQKIEKLIALAKRLKSDGKILRVERAGQVQELATLSVDQVLEAASETAQKQP